MRAARVKVSMIQYVITSPGARKRSLEKIWVNKKLASKYNVFIKLGASLKKLLRVSLGVRNLARA